MYINQRNCVTLCFETRPRWLGILEAQTFVAWALQLRCGVVGSDPDPWVPPGLQPPRVRSECLLWILEAFKALGSFLLPSHSHISFRGAEFTQLHFLLLFFGFLVLVSKVLSEDLHPVGAPSGWDRTERLSCLWKKPWKTVQTLMCNYSVKQQNPGSASSLAALCFGPKEIHLPGEFRESVPGWARGARHGRKLMDLISRAGLFFPWLSVSICQWIHVLTLTTALEEPAPPGLVAACWWEGRGQGCRRVKCLQGRLEAMQTRNGARFRCLQPKHFQSRINNTTFQLFTMKNNQHFVSRQFSKHNMNSGRASKLFRKCWAYIWIPFVKSFCKMLFKDNFFHPSHGSSGSQGRSMTD